MANLELIAPQKVAHFRYSTAPAHNLMCSLFLINEDKEDITEWTTKVTRELSDDQLADNKMIASIASRLLQGKDWESFPEWLDHVKSSDPSDLQDWLVTDFLKACAKYNDVSPEELPTREEILTNEEIYFETYQQVCDLKGHPFDREYHRKEYQMLLDPQRAQEKIVAHLEWMWEEYLLEEWEHIQPMLQDSLKAFESFEFSGMSTEEALCRISGRDQMPQIWNKWISTVEEVVIIPSAHIGPYLMTIDKVENKVWLVVRAHIPEGVAISSPSLTRSELLMQLSALSNDTRLRILELLKEKGELNANELQNQLGLTQSATSRHVLQLVATSYLHQRRLDGVKQYYINTQRIGQTCDALVQFLK